MRNSRGENLPNLLSVAKDIIEYGADGITVHPRPDERHITYADVRALKTLCDEKEVPLNIEGYPSEDFLKMVLDVSPEQVTFVPDLPGALTSNQGWNVKKESNLLKNCIEESKSKADSYLDFFRP